MGSRSYKEGEICGRHQGQRGLEANSKDITVRRWKQDFLHYLRTLEEQQVVLR